MLDFVAKQKKGYVTAQMEPEAAQVLQMLVDDTGLSKTEIYSRIMRFMASQTDVIRGIVLDTYPRSIKQDVARMLLEKMAADPPREGAEITEEAARRIALARQPGRSAKSPPAAGREPTREAR